MLIHITAGRMENVIFKGKRRSTQGEGLPSLKCRHQENRDAGVSLAPGARPADLHHKYWLKE